MSARAALAPFALALVVAIAAEPAKATAPRTWESRMAAAAAYAESRAGTLSLAVVDESGRLHSYHARAVAPSASVLKAMLLVAYLRRSDVRDRALRQWERDLLAPMIRRSDNAAAARMVGLAGEAQLNALARAAGMEHFRLHWPIWGATEITPRGQALFFDRLASLLPPRHRAYALRLLATVVPSQRWGVGRVSHRGWRLYFKGGWGSGTGLVDHQVALYEAGGERFSLALFTRFNPDHEYGKETLRGLAARLLDGVPHPGARGVAPARRASIDAGYTVFAQHGCTELRIAPLGGHARAYATGAPSCAGFRMVSAGPGALWSWREAGESKLATASYSNAAVADLGPFDGSDPLGQLAGHGRFLAYSHGDEVTRVGGADCALPADELGVGAGRLALASHRTIRVADPSTCRVVRTLITEAAVRGVAVGGDFVVALTEGRGGRRRLERFRISTGAQLGRTGVPASTLSALDMSRRWLLFRTPHSVRVLVLDTGRTHTLWRPRIAPAGAGLSGGRALWVESHKGAARVWSFGLPAAE